MPHVEENIVASASGFFPGASQVSPLMLADRLLTLAQDADRAGFIGPAQRLLKLAFAVCDERPN